MKQGMVPPFYQIMNQFRMMCRNELPGFDLSQNEVYILTFLMKVPEADTARKISEFLGMSPSLVSHSIDSLRRKKLIELIQDEADRRVFHIRLDPENESLILKIRQLDKKLFEHLLEGIEPEKIKIFEEVLRKILQNIQNQGREEKK